MTDVNITWLVVALMVGIIIGNANIEIPHTDDISSLIDKASDIIKNEPLECPVGYYKVFAEGFEPEGDEWSIDPDGRYVMCVELKPVQKIEFYEFYATGDDLWGAWYEIGDKVASINWFNDTIGHSFNGEIISVNFRENTVIVRTFDESKLSGSGGGGVTHQVKYQKLMRENVWTSSNDPDYIRYEWVQFVDGVIRAEIDDSMICIDYTVDRMWVKPFHSACLPIVSIIDENDTKIGSVFLLDYNDETIKNMSHDEIINTTDNISTAGAKNIVFFNSTVLIEF